MSVFVVLVNSNLPLFYFPPSFVLYILDIAYIAGAPVNKPDAEVQSTIVPATIIEHQRHDENINEGKVPDYTKPKASARNCTIC